MYYAPRLKDSKRIYIAKFNNCLSDVIFCNCPYRAYKCKRKSTLEKKLKEFKLENYITIEEIQEEN